MEIHVWKAQPVVHDEPVSSVILRIEDPIPDSQDLEHAGAMFRRDAERILLALRSLPQGTWYELLVLMLKQAPSLYRVPFQSAREDG